MSDCDCGKNPHEIDCWIFAGDNQIRRENMREIKPDDVVTEIGRSSFPQSGELRRASEDYYEKLNKAAANQVNLPTKRETTEQVLQERGKVYGSFSGHARITQILKVQFYDHMRHHNPKGYEAILNNATVREGIEMIFHKLGRVANGDPLYPDNFVDIAGYAKLVVEELESEF